MKDTSGHIFEGRNSELDEENDRQWIPPNVHYVLKHRAYLLPLPCPEISNRCTCM